jgi:hypothetical protein
LLGCTSRATPTTTGQTIGSTAQASACGFAASAALGLAFGIADQEGDCTSTVEGLPVRAMAFIWAVILVGGIAYFSVIGLTHH